jgi:hypothetical protein
MPLNGASHSEFQFHLHGNYALAAIANQSYAEQAVGGDVV